MTSAPSRGQATLSVVLLIGGIVSTIVIAISLVSIGLIGTGFGADAQQRARGGALAGIEDAALRLARDTSYAGTYSVDVGVTTASVTVYASTPSSGFSAVSSAATYGLRRVRLYAVYAIDPATAVPTLVSLADQ